MSSTEFETSETGSLRVTYAANARRRGGVLQRETRAAETLCATQWNSDAIERFCRQREDSRSAHGVGGRETENEWWFRSWDEVRRQVASDREILDSDPEKNDKSTDTVVCASSQLATKRLENTSEECLDSERAGECRRDQHSDER